MSFGLPLFEDILKIYNTFWYVRLFRNVVEKRNFIFWSWPNVRMSNFSYISVVSYVTSIIPKMKIKM